jgi:hypothetical protein
MMILISVRPLTHFRVFGIDWNWNTHTHNTQIRKYRDSEDKEQARGRPQIIHICDKADYGKWIGFLYCTC